MKILVINPNTTVEMTKQVETAMNAVKRADTTLEVTNPTAGPAGVASSYDEIVAGYELVKLVQAAKGSNYDAVVIACYSDPGIVAAKELLDIPVVGIAEAAMHLACMLGDKFTVLTSSKARIPPRRAMCGTTASEAGWLRFAQLASAWPRPLMSPRERRKPPSLWGRRPLKRMVPRSSS
jgi:Asp/Glu/hydantoin racemase